MKLRMNPIVVFLTQGLPEPEEAGCRGQEVAHERTRILQTG